MAGSNHGPGRHRNETELGLYHGIFFCAYTGASVSRLAAQQLIMQLGLLSNQAVWQHLPMLGSILLAVLFAGLQVFCTHPDLMQFGRL